MSPLPKTLRIGSYTWKIRCSNSKKHIKRLDEKSADGLTLGRELTIFIRPGFDIQYERAIVLHEILHAVRDSTGVEIDLNKAEESFIQAVDAPLLAVLQDNPDLLDYLGIGFE